MCLFTATDGVGTKVKLHKQYGTNVYAGIDAVAMVVNDLYRYGAKPIMLSNYFATGKLDEQVYRDVIYGISCACEFASCALTGGETAEMPGMYLNGDYDVAATAVGIATKQDLINPSRIRYGDIIIGIPSNGIHSNGLSLVRKVIENKTDFSYEWFTDPTRIYCSLPLLDNHYIHGIAHITGGGLLGKLGAIIPDNLKAVVDPNTWYIHECFEYIQKTGNILDSEMYSVFNMGIGMVLICNPGYEDKIVDIENDARVIGQVVSGSGNKVELI